LFNNEGGIVENINEWHLDKRIPIALVFAILVQTAGIGIWVGTLQSRVSSIEARQSENIAMLSGLTQTRIQTGERLATLEENARTIRSLLERIDRKLESVPIPKPKSQADE